MTPADLMELGLRLFPVTPQKRPALKGWQTYAKMATIDHIRQAWKAGYRAFGIYLAPSRLVVLDADTPQADEWSQHMLPDTPMMTKTKRGMHRYYRLGDGVNAPKDNRPIAGVALDRKAKGFVIAPGSIIGGFTYSETSFWDTPLDELPEYPTGAFPQEREMVRCHVDVSDIAITDTGKSIVRWFIENSDPSVQGSDGSKAMKRAASFFRNGMALSVDEATACMQFWNEAKASPLWSDREIAHALETSYREGAINGRPRGWAYADWAKS